MYAQLLLFFFSANVKQTEWGGKKTTILISGTVTTKFCGERK